MHCLAFLLTAASAASIPLVPRELPPSSSLPSGWTYVGCYVDSVSDRALDYGYQSVDYQSGEQCIRYCEARGYGVAGTGE
jgi:hypothetical protein